MIITNNIFDCSLVYMYKIHVYDKKNRSRVFIFGYLNIEINIITNRKFLLSFVI